MRNSQGQNGSLPYNDLMQRAFNNAQQGGFGHSELVNGFGSGGVPQACAQHGGMATPPHPYVPYAPGGQHPHGCMTPPGAPHAMRQAAVGYGSGNVQMSNFLHGATIIEPTNFTGPMVPSGHGPPQGAQQQMMTPVPFHMAGAYQQPTMQQAHGFLAPTAAAAAAAATAAASAMHSPKVPAAPPSTPAPGDRNGSRSRQRVDMNEMNQRMAYLEETNRKLLQDLQLQRQQSATYMHPSMHSGLRPHAMPYSPSMSSGSMYGTSMPRPREVNRIVVPKFSHSTQEAAKNSVYLFNNMLGTVQLKEQAMGTCVITPEDDVTLSQLVVKWVEAEPSILTDIRNRFGDFDGSGKAKYDHIRAFYVDPWDNEYISAEQEMEKFDWSSIFNGNGEHLSKGLNAVWGIVRRLDPTRQSNPTFWISKIMQEAPENVVLEMERQVLTPAQSKYRSTYLSDPTVFTRVAALSLNAIQRRRGNSPQPGLHAMQDRGRSFQRGGPGQRSQPGRSGNGCRQCGIFNCPGAKGGLCDVCGYIRPERVQEIIDMKDGGKYKDLVNAKRAEKGEKFRIGDGMGAHRLRTRDDRKLPPRRRNDHYFDDEDEEEGEDAGAEEVIDEDQLAGVYADMEAMWRTDLHAQPTEAKMNMQLLFDGLNAETEHGEVSLETSAPSDSSTWGAMDYLSATALVEENNIDPLGSSQIAVVHPYDAGAGERQQVLSSDGLSGDVPVQESLRVSAPRKPSTWGAMDHISATALVEENNIDPLGSPQIAVVRPYDAGAGERQRVLSSDGLSGDVPVQESLRVAAPREPSTWGAMDHISATALVEENNIDPLGSSQIAVVRPYDAGAGARQKVLSSDGVSGDVSAQASLSRSAPRKHRTWGALRPCSGTATGVESNIAPLGSIQIASVRPYAPVANAGQKVLSSDGESGDVSAQVHLMQTAPRRIQVWGALRPCSGTATGVESNIAPLGSIQIASVRPYAPAANAGQQVLSSGGESGDVSAQMHLMQSAPRRLQVWGAMRPCSGTATGAESNIAPLGSVQIASVRPYAPVANASQQVLSSDGESGDVSAQMHLMQSAPREVQVWGALHPCSDTAPAMESNIAPLGSVQIASVHPYASVANATSAMHVFDGEAETVTWKPARGSSGLSAGEPQPPRVAIFRRSAHQRDVQMMTDVDQSYDGYIQRPCERLSVAVSTSMQLNVHEIEQDLVDTLLYECDEQDHGSLLEVACMCCDKPMLFPAPKMSVNSASMPTVSAQSPPLTQVAADGIRTYLTTRPKKPYVVYIAGGERRMGDFTEHMDKLSKGCVETIIVDTVLGGHMHDATAPKCFDWLRELATGKLCIAVLSTPPCGPWCALRGLGEGPKQLFSLDAVDGIKVGGTVLPGATKAMKLLKACNVVLRIAAKAGKMVMLEHPVGRGENSQYYIPGRERHSTMWDTTDVEQMVKELLMDYFDFDRCAPPINDASQKTTRLAANHPLFGFLAGKLAKSKCQCKPGTHQSLMTMHGDGLTFATQGTGTFNSSLNEILVVCTLAARAAQLRQTPNGGSVNVTQQGGTDVQDCIYSIDSAFPENSLIEDSIVEWGTKVVSVLLDSCSDAHIVPDRRAFVQLMPPDIGNIKVGKDGESINFAGMGPAVLNITWLCNGTYVRKGLILDKAYLPNTGESSQYIISTGRLYKLQGVKIFENGVDELVAGDYVAAFHRRFYSPHIDATVMINLQDGMSISVHVRGQPKSSKRLTHLRLCHMNDDDLTVLTGAGGTCLCHICALFKQRYPSAYPSSKITEVGELVHVDAWGPFSTPAAVTGWQFIIGAVDSAQPLANAVGSKQPTGILAANFVESLYQTYAMTYKKPLKCIRFDGGSYFDCPPVYAVMTKYNIAREQSAPYMHHQLKMERWWATMQHDAAAMSGTLSLSKGHFIHACLHAIHVRTVTARRRGDKMTAWELVTGSKFNLERFRIFGSPAYGFLPKEQRRQLQHDKSDPTAIHGRYVGNTGESWMILTPTKIHYVGAGIIDEKQSLRDARCPEGRPEYYAELLPQALDGNDVYDASAQVIGRAVQSESPAQPVPAEQQVPQPRVQQQRPQRQREPIQRLDPSASATATAAATATATRAVRESANDKKSRDQVLVPSDMWPRFPCTEMNGRGWRAEVVTRQKDRIQVRFTNARTKEGKEWGTHWLRPDAVIVLDESGEPVDTSGADERSEHEAMRMQAMSFSGESVPMEMLTEHAWFGALATESGPSAYELEAPDYQMQCAAMSILPSADETCLFLGVHAGLPKIKQVLVTLEDGKTEWRPLPATWRQAQTLPNASNWKMAMEAFMDKTRLVDAYMPATAEDVKGRQLDNVSWVLTWKGTPPKESARLVFNYNARTTVFDEMSYSNVAKAPHVKAFLHCEMANGATIVRRDIVNAHQSVRRSPELDKCITRNVPGVPVTDADGNEAPGVVWLNYLNGMPPAGKAFTMDVTSWMENYKMVRNPMEDFQFNRFFDVIPEGGVTEWRQPEKYIKTIHIVDDYLVAYKGPPSLLEEFDAHMERKWVLKKMGLDGFLNNQYYVDLPTRTVTITMEVRIAEIMKEHLADEMDGRSCPSVPNHPRLAKLNKTDPAISPDRAKQMHRLSAQLMYVVVQVYFHGQYTVFYCARFSSTPTELWAECLLHALRHIYGYMHIGLTLGGTSGLAVSGSRPSPSSPTQEIGAHTDAGHAQPGPSIGGYTVEIDGTTTHAVSGAHHATTLGTTDSESYQASQAVAGIVAMREYMTGMGYPQLRPSIILGDNSGTIAKSTDSVSDKRSLYMRRRITFILMAKQAQAVRMQWVPSELNRADILTKGLSAKAFSRLRDVIMNVGKMAVRLHHFVWTKMT